MELLFVVLIGIGLGLIGRAAVPGRQLLGVPLLPAVGGSAGALCWVALTWVGWRWNGGWIWVVTVLVAALAVVLTGLLLPRARAASDARLFDRIAHTS